MYSSTILVVKNSYNVCRCFSYPYPPSPLRRTVPLSRPSVSSILPSRSRPNEATSAAISDTITLAAAAVAAPPALLLPPALLDPAAAAAAAFADI